MLPKLLPFHNPDLVRFWRMRTNSFTLKIRGRQTLFSKECVPVKHDGQEQEQLNFGQRFSSTNPPSSWKWQPIALIGDQLTIGVDVTVKVELLGVVPAGRVKM